MTKLEKEKYTGLMITVTPTGEAKETREKHENYFEYVVRELLFKTIEYMTSQDVQILRRKNSFRYLRLPPKQIPHRFPSAYCHISYNYFVAQKWLKKSSKGLGRYMPLSFKVLKILGKWKIILTFSKGTPIIHISTHQMNSDFWTVLFTWEI